MRPIFNYCASGIAGDGHYAWLISRHVKIDETCARWSICLCEERVIIMANILFLEGLFNIF